MSIDVITLAASKNYTDKQIEKASIKGVDLSGYVQTVNGVSPDANGNVEIPVGGVAGGGLSTTAANLFIAILREGVYSTNQSGNITALAAELGVTEEVPDIPDEPDEPEKTLTSISATYSGGSVPVGTAVSDLTGIVVTGHYSDGTTETVTGYTLSGNIAEGSNTVTVTYEGKTATFTVTGVAESGGDDGKVYITNTLVWEDGYYITNSGTFTESAGKSLSGYVDITGHSNVVFEDTTDATLLSAGASFWTAEKTFISRGGRYYRKSNTNYPSPCVVEIPQNAVYTRLDIGKNDKGRFEVYLM